MNPLLLGGALVQTAPPMSDSSPDLPEVEPNDPEAVAVAVETARALFRSGDRLESLRWLRRAAERAEESGDDVRAVHLARSAADLSTALQSVQPPPPVTPTLQPPPPPPPPPAPVPPPPAPAPVPPPPAPIPAPVPVASAPPPPPPAPVPAPASRRHDDAATLAPYDDFSDKTQVDATAPLVRDVQHTGVQITELPQSAQHSPRSVTMPSPPSSTSEATVTNAHFAPPVEVVTPATRAAVRVAVTRDPESPGTWLVRPLPEGSAVPQGCEEALLIALDSKSKLVR